jgi:hypothetical protein
MGRHKGSKNKKHKEIPVKVKRGRGRPRGTGKNQKIISEARQEPITEAKSDNISPNDVRNEINKLRRLKLQMRARTPERVEIHRKIKALQKQLSDNKAERIEENPEKKRLIEEILQKDELARTLNTDLGKFTMAELYIHLERLNKNKRR